VSRTKRTSGRSAGTAPFCVPKSSGGDFLTKTIVRFNKKEIEMRKTITCTAVLRQSVRETLHSLEPSPVTSPCSFGAAVPVAGVCAAEPVLPETERLLGAAGISATASVPLRGEASRN